jgi:hypothetical protein
MLKEVGTSGQISLGKRLAGQLFEVVFHADGRVEMLPMRGGYAACNAWSLENRLALDDYAARIDREGTAAEQLLSFLAKAEAPLRS